MSLHFIPHALGLGNFRLNLEVNRMLRSISFSEHIINNSSPRPSWRKQ